MKTSTFIWIVLVTVAGLGAAYVLEAPLFLGFSVGLLALMIAVRRGSLAKGKELLSMMLEGVGHTREVVWILLLVGLLIPVWSAGGTIAFLVDAGLRLLHPEWIVTFGFLFSAVIAMTLGTSTGTLSAVGIPMIGVAAHMGVPLSVTAGALVSGAFVGDRTSPFSSAHLLVASSTGVPERSLFRLLQPTTYMAFAAAVLFFGALDVFGDWGGSVNGLSSESAGLTMHPLLAIPPALLLVSILLRLRTRYAFLLAIVSGVGIGAYLQGGSLLEWLYWLWHGYETPSAASGASVTHGKGLAGMTDLVILIALAGAYTGILERTGIIRPIAARLLGSGPSMTAATVRTGLFGFGLGLVSCTQTLPIMMTGRSLVGVWTERFPREHLARVTADTSLLLAALVPWNMLAVLCATILGVPVEQYAPFAIFVWLPPLLTVAWSAWRGPRERGAAGLGRG